MSRYQYAALCAFVGLSWALMVACGIFAIWTATGAEAVKWQATMLVWGFVNTGLTGGVALAFESVRGAR